MRLRKLGNGISLEGKRVLVRIDANVPIVNGKVKDGPHGRIARSAVDLLWLSQRKAKVIVITHIGRPDGRRIPAYSVKPVAKRLSGLLGMRVKTTRTIIGVDAQKAVGAMQNGDVLLLENLRFDAREKGNAPSFASALAKLGDIYVNDAFSVSHRAHASVDAITSELTSFAGPLLANEISQLSKLGKKNKHPFILVLGGLKMTTKLPIIERFISQLDHLLVGGALANVFFVAQGKFVGKSEYENDSVASAKRLLDIHKDKIVLPTDLIAVRSLRKDAKREVVLPDCICATQRVVDIGPETVKHFNGLINCSRTIVWNGPLGFCEIRPFCSGTLEVAKTIAARTGKAMTIVGGGDTMPLIENLGLADKYSLLSTGGGAMLQFLAGEPLPGIEALKV